MKIRTIKINIFYMTMNMQKNLMLCKEFFKQENNDELTDVELSIIEDFLKVCNDDIEELYYIDNIDNGVEKIDWGDGNGDDKQLVLFNSFKDGEPLEDLICFIIASQKLADIDLVDFVKTFPKDIYDMMTKPSDDALIDYDGYDAKKLKEYMESKE
jgi:hypothetical protein